MNFIIFGPQGSGKGTQAEKLSEKYNLEHIETGQIFRDMMHEDTELGRTVRHLLNQKEMVPDDITVDVLEHFVEKVDTSRGVILDSAPRTMGQIELVEQMLEQLGRNLDKAIYISLPYEESVKRITKRYQCCQCKKALIMGGDIASVDDCCPECGGKALQREDDTPEGIAKRLRIFYEVTMPVVEHYRQKGMLIEVDGNRTVEEVFENIVHIIE